MNFKFNNHEYKLILTNHIYEVRDGEKHHRGFGITEDGFKNIMLEALKNGLTAYGLYKEEKVKIVAFSEFRRITLLVVKEQYFFRVITVIQERLDKISLKNENFIKENKVIKLFKYKIPSLNEEGNKAKKIKLIQSKPKKRNPIRNPIRKIV